MGDPQTVAEIVSGEIPNECQPKGIHKIHHTITIVHDSVAYLCYRELTPPVSVIASIQNAAKKQPATNRHMAILFDVLGPSKESFEK